MVKRLEWSKRAEADLDRLLVYYAETVSIHLAQEALDYITQSVEDLATRPVTHRPGKRDTRECVLKRFPYTIIYRITPVAIQIVRILHQARKYFN